MNPQDVLARLPADLPWMVMFRTLAVTRLVAPATVKQMFFLPEETDLEQVAFVVLTAHGRCLAPADGAALIPVGGTPAWPPLAAADTLWGRYRTPLERLALADADCVGLGRHPDQPPAFLQVRIRDGVGEATALFTRPPSLEHYDLLPAVGVDFRDGRQEGEHYVARFNNRVPTHVKAGRLAGFTRTAHCNDFFLNHGRVDERLAEGLARAFADRLDAGRAAAREAVIRLAGEVARASLAMVCRPPPPEPEFAYGDLVPLGLLARALDAVIAATPRPAPLVAVRDRRVRDGLRRRLEDARQDGLWAFHTGRLVTATDSALVLLGVGDPVAVAALEAFADGAGGYLPQRAAAEPGAREMRSAPENRHWRQADLGTTCLVRGLRAETGLAAVTPLEYLEARFPERGGLFFANPYLMDWALAFALRGEPAADPTRRRLRDEVLESANPDGSFGAYDPFLSTALAILTLDACGYRGRALRLAQLRLLNLMEATPWPATTPFFSTFLEDGPGEGDQRFRCGATAHALSLYRDQHRVILAAVTALALQVDCRVDDAEPLPGRGEGAHPRYRCPSPQEYVARFALPPYLRGMTAAGGP